MKILTVDRLRAWEQHTCNSENIAPIDLAKRAASAFVVELKRHFLPLPTWICVGSGGNGADGFLIAALLLQARWPVQGVLMMQDGQEPSLLNRQAQQAYSGPVHPIRYVSDIPNLSAQGLVIDALVGIGISSPLGGVSSELVRQINQRSMKVVSVDVPSGLAPEGFLPNATAIHADLTLTFSCPKLSFFMEESAPFVGQFVVVDLGLDKEFLWKEKATFHAITPSGLLQGGAQNLLSHQPWQEKHQRGSAGLMVGQKEMIGAATLAGMGALRSGVGRLTAQAPACGELILQTALPEMMLKLDVSKTHLSELKLPLEHLTAIGLGPGLGEHSATKSLLKKIAKIRQKNRVMPPLVLDADALNLSSKLPKAHQSALFKDSILTPHKKELARIVGESEHSFERLLKQIHLAMEHSAVVVCKGRFSAIALPTGEVFFNLTGNHGLAKGGSGDVLLGLITGIRAQIPRADLAALVGVYIHGLAADLAVKTLGPRGLLPSDVASFIPAAWEQLIPHPHT